MGSIGPRPSTWLPSAVRARGWSRCSGWNTASQPWKPCWNSSRALEPDPDQVRVVLETRHGLLVERLLEAGFVVVPVNPDLIARRRGPAKKKDDVEDARIACLLALDRFQPLRPLIPHGELAAELRLLGRDDARACPDERRLLQKIFFAFF